MTIEYKDSKRIVALQTDISKNIVTINHRCSTTDDHAYADLGSALSNTSWVMRYKMVISGYSASSNNPNNAYLFAISQTTANNMSDQSLGLKMRIGGGSGYSDFFVGGGTSSQNNAEGYEGSLFSSQTTANGTWYVEYIRNGSSFSIRLTTSSDYTGGELDTWSTSGTVENLRYIKYTNRDDHTSSHVLVATISEIKIYDGVTSATGTFVRDGTWTASASNKVTVATEANKPTNVQDNSILIEKDTANRYWFDADPTATTTKTYDHSGDSVVSVRSVSNSTNWWEAPRQGILIEAGHASVGTYVKKISLPLLKSGTPTGNYTFAIRDSSETIKGSATGVANNLTTSYVITEVTLNTAVLIEVGDHVTIEYDNTAPATGKLSFPTSTSGWVANTDQQNWISSAWQGDGDGAGAGRKWQFTFDSTPASITLPATWTYEPNANSSPLFDTHNGTGNSNSTTITVASNDNRLLIAHVGHSGTGVTVNSVTSNVSGVFTQLMTQNSDASTNNKTDVWYLKAPATGSHTVTVVYSGSVTNRSIALHSLYNVDQTTPINLSSKASAGSSTGTPITVDITPTIKNSVLMAVSQAQYSANTPSDTSIYMATYASGGDFNMSGQKKLSPTRGSSNTMSWVKNSNGAWSTVAFEVIGV